MKRDASDTPPGARRRSGSLELVRHCLDLETEDLDFSIRIGADYILEPGSPARGADFFSAGEPGQDPAITFVDIRAEIGRMEKGDFVPLQALEPETLSRLVLEVPGIMDSLENEAFRVEGWT